MKQMWLLGLLFLAAQANAAMLQGSTFEWFSLEKLNNVIIDINSIPMQRIVAEQGDYSLELQKGDYLLHAEFFENNELKYVADENVSIAADGNFILDIILFPTSETELNEQIEPGLDANIDFPSAEEEEKAKTSAFDLLTAMVIIMLLLVLALLFVLWLELRQMKQKSKQAPEKNEKAEIIAEKTKANSYITAVLDEKRQLEKTEKLDKYAREVLEALKNSGNRLTQKELREKVQSVGEAKISLILSELEEMGKIKKIKKGRGNIIVLKET